MMRHCQKKTQRCASNKHNNKKDKTMGKKLNIIETGENTQDVFQTKANGSVKKKAGRKLTAGTPRTEKVLLNLTKEEYAEAEKAMDKKGERKLAVFLRNAALENM